MSDERLRELERRWRETGTVADEVPYLLELERSGRLPPRALELAAYLGDVAAAEALSPRQPGKFSVLPRSADPWDLEALESFRVFLIRVLEIGGPQALIRAATVSAWSILPHFETLRPNDARPRTAVELAEACLRGEVATQERVSRVVDGAASASRDLWSGDLFTDPGPPEECGVAEFAASLCIIAYELARSNEGPRGGSWLKVVDEVMEGVGSVRPDWSSLAAACADRIVKWALRRAP